MGSEFAFDCCEPYFEENGDEMNIASQKKNCLTKPVYMSCCRAPTLKNWVTDTFVEYIVDDWMAIQRAVATESIYRSSEWMYDTVLVSVEKPQLSSENNFSSGKIRAWFGIALAFLRVALDALENGRCSRLWDISFLSVLKSEESRFASFSGTRHE